LDFYILGHAGSNTALRATNVTFGYSNDTPVFSGINLELREGQIVAVLGQCGSGKSTLLKLIAGLLKPTKGQIEWLGAAPLAKQRTQQSKSGILGYAMQFPEKQLFAKDILTDVAFGPKNLGLNTNEAATRARQTLEEIGLAPTYFASKSPFVVSGGEQRKVALAGVLAMSPKVIVMDEPTSALDASTRRDLAAILRHASDTGCAILIATHDAEFINMLAQ
jgi:energy-coupling factor transport system ATP-binding protein